MKLTKIIKRLLLSVVALFVLLLGAAFAVPYFFKDKILEQVKVAVNKDLNATVDFTDVDISIMRHFPKISVKLVNLDVTGKDDFDGVKLLHTDGLDLALNFWSVYEGGNPYVINSIHLEKPLVNVVVLKNGVANYDITKPKEKAEPSNFKLSLDNYSVNQGRFIYDDHTMDYFMDMNGITHEGSGEMTADVYDLDTDTKVDSLTVSYGGIKYLSNAHTDLATKVNVNMKDMKFTLKDTKAKVNDLVMETGGWLQMKGDDKIMDLTFKAPSNNFKDLFSIIPAAYSSNYSDVKATGSFNFDGFVKGTYNAKTPQYPAFTINTNVQNGSVQYPKLPMGITDINTKINVALPSSNFDALKIDVPNFKMKMGQNPFEAVFFLRTPVSDPNVDLKAKGVINLSELTKVLPMESVQNLTGIINADITIKTLLSYIEKKQYDKVDMKGAMEIKGMNVKAKGYPTIMINDVVTNFTPNMVNVDNFVGKLGKSDVKASGSIDNILAFFSTNRTMTGKVKFESDLFDANEWLGSTPSVSNDKNVGKAPVDDTKNAARPFDRFDFTVDGKINRLLYEKYDIQNSVAAGHFTPNKFSVSNFQTKIGNSDIGGKGELVGVFDWLFDNKTLGGQLLLTSNYMDLNQFMTEKPQTNVAVNTATEPIAVPKNVDVMVFADMKRVLYTNMDLTNVKGKLAVQNEEVKIVDGEANVFGGKTEIDGGYNTQDPAKPKFKLAFDVKNIDFKQSFTTLNTFQKLAPIGQFLSGKFNTSFEMNGALGKDLSPDISSLTMSGFFQTIQGFLSGLKPLEEISNKLNISELKNLDLKETKNWFEVNNGTVEVKEFTKNIKDIALKIKGTHSLTNEMNYSVSTKIPRKKLESNAVGAAAGAGFNVLVSEASKLGINIKNSEFVNVLFSITGSMLKPKVSMKLLGGDGETSLADAAKGAANAVITKAKDSITTRANEELDKAKNKAKELADKAIDSAKNVVTTKVNEAKDQAVEKAKAEAAKVLEKELGDKVGQKVGTEIDKQLGKTEAGEKVKKEADKLKDKLDKWDPFKKKKDPPPPPPDNGN
jgi:hypothetical protein